jgi:hypothetical protein
MTILTNTFTTYSQKGIREDLMDKIFMISPTQTPFTSMVKKGKANSAYVEWQTDVLAAAANNAQLEGDDVSTIGATVATARIGNYCQVSTKSLIVSGTAQAVKTAGRKDEVALQLAKKGAELKRDMEFALCQNTTYVAGNATTARQTRGLEGWVATSNSLGASGVAPNPGTNTAPTDGTQRAITEALLTTVLANVFTQGGDPDILMTGPLNKQKISAISTLGASTRYDKGEDKRVTAAVDFYVSDFGELKIVPNRFQRERTAFVLQSDLWELAFLRPIEIAPLAKTGDADKKLLTCEYALKSYQEAGNGAIRDLT